MLHADVQCSTRKHETVHGHAHRRGRGRTVAFGMAGGRQRGMVRSHGNRRSGIQERPVRPARLRSWLEVDAQRHLRHKHGTHQAVRRKPIAGGHDENVM